MGVTIDTSGSFAVAALSGEFGLIDQEGVGERLGALVAAPESRVAVVLKDLKQINSVGLSVLINVVTRARLNRSRVVLVAPSPFVANVLEVTALDQWFDIVDDLTAADEQLQAHAPPD